MCFRKVIKWSSYVDWKCLVGTCKWTVVQLTPENNSPKYPVNELRSGAKKTFHRDGIIKILPLIMSCKSHIQVEIKRVTVAQWEVNIHRVGGGGLSVIRPRNLVFLLMQFHTFLLRGGLSSIPGLLPRTGIVQRHVTHSCALMLCGELIPWLQRQLLEKAKQH